MYLNLMSSKNILSVAKTVFVSRFKTRQAHKTISRQLSICKFRSGNFQAIPPSSISVLVINPLFLSRTFGHYQKRFYRSSRISQHPRNTRDTPQQSTPELMNFPWVIWPSLWYTFRNWIFANLIIKPYLDNDFTLSSFKNGAIQALVHVSQEISKGNFTDLEGFITKPSLEEAQRNYSLLSLKQRLDLAVVAEDIFFCFPYQIGVMFTNEGGPKERVFVEITMCYHIFRGLKDHIENIAQSKSSRDQGVYTNYDEITIANYRFIREYTKGVEGDWTVNVANHFKPGEILRQRQL